MKRLPSENDDEPPRERKRPTFLSVGRDVITSQLMQRSLVPIIEQLVRRVVREELEHAFIQRIPPGPRPPITGIQAPGATGPQLHFNARLSDTLFTGSRVTPAQIFIRNGYSEETVTMGPLSSLKVEIVVLDGDFGKDEKVDWTKEEFDSNIVRERDGRRPLLAGDLTITLREGVGTFDNVTFTDNSSWIRSRRFRLGVRVVESSGTVERVREARSEPFIVKDHRGELYKKHDSPSLGDEVWRLKNIGKDGVFRKRLTDNKIETVQQFLRVLVTNPDWLRTILGPGMSKKVWEETIKHAQKCTLDDKFYIYFSAGQEVGLLLNSIYEVRQVTFNNCPSFQSLHSLTPFQMNLVEKVKKEAYGNLDHIVEFDGLPFFGLSRPLLEPLQPAVPETGMGLHDADLISHQNELAVLNFMHSTNPPAQDFTVQLPQLKDITFTPDVHARQLFSLMQSNRFNAQVADQVSHEDNAIIPHDLQLSQSVSPIQTGDTFGMNDPFRVSYGDTGNRWSANESLGTVASDRLFLEDSPVQVFNWLNGSLQVQSDQMGGTGFPTHFHSSDLGSTSLGMVKPKGWLKLAAPLKWGILVRKDVAARRMAESCT